VGSSARAFRSSGRKLSRESWIGPASATTGESSHTPRNAASTVSQKRSGSSSPGSSETHATLPDHVSERSHEHSSAVLPLPGGPQTSVIGPAVPRSMRSTSRGRSISPAGSAGTRSCVVSRGGFTSSCPSTGTRLHDSL